MAWPARYRRQVQRRASDASSSGGRSRKMAIPARVSPDLPGDGWCGGTKGSADINDSQCRLSSGSGTCRAVVPVGRVPNVSAPPGLGRERQVVGRKRHREGSPERGRNAWRPTASATGGTCAGGAPAPLKHPWRPDSNGVTSHLPFPPDVPMTSSSIPKLAAHGAEIPAIGFGTGQLADPAAAVASALAAGYRHLDAARKYGTEEGVG